MANKCLTIFDILHEKHIRFNNKNCIDLEC